jgi:CHAD domain-containing protein
MALDPKKLQKPFDKLRKTLKKLPRQPTPEEVHDIRTQTRRVEATLHALHFDRVRPGKRVLKAVTPVRKRAGKVRDMDVLTGFASTLDGSSDRDCPVQLLEYLGHERYRSTRKLRQIVAKKQGSTSRFLKRIERSIKRHVNGGRGREDWSADAATDALQLSRELANWPKLTKDNLHPFRLKVKELRYVLQLSGDNNELIQKLGEAKDKIGEWHDWVELATIADEVLQHTARCDVREQIHAGAQQRFTDALTTANQLREKYFAPSSAKKRGTNGTRVKERVLEVAAELAA